MFPHPESDGLANLRCTIGRLRGLAMALLGLWLAASSRAAEGPVVLSASALKQLTLEELLDVEVTSVSRHPERLLDAPSAIQVIHGDEIARSGASNLPEALRLAPNLQVAQKNPHDWGVSARGFNAALANKLLVMIDGRTVYTPLFSGVFWDVQDYLLEDIDRIEVVSGPGATLWGANAVNGVINIKSKNARDTQGLYVEGGGGTELRAFGGVRYGTAVGDRAYLRVYGKASERDDAVLPSGADAHDSALMRRGGFRFDSELAGDSAITVQGDLYRGSEYVVTGGNQRVSGGNLLGRWSHAWSNEADVSVQLYYDHTHLVDPITNQFGSVQYLTDDLDTYDLDLQHRFAFGPRNEVMWGLGYRFTHDAVKNASNSAFIPDRIDRDLFSAFLQDIITVRPRWFLTLGSKLEHNDYTRWEFEPSVRLAWRLAPAHTAWAAVSRAVRMPSRYDRDIVQPAPPRVIASGSKQFRSETLIAYELGYRAQLMTSLTTSVALFFNDYDRLRSFGPLPGTTAAPFYFGNNLSAHTYGAEFSAQYQVRPDWRLRASYTYLNEDLTVQRGTTDLFGGRNEVSDPKHQVMLGSSWDFPHGITFDANLRWIDTLPTTGQPVPAYAEADARLGWHVTDAVEFSLVGQNLLHNHHPEFGIGTPRREEIDRSVYAKVSVRF